MDHGLEIPSQPFFVQGIKKVYRGGSTIAYFIIVEK
jgi:hypothetical protein